ncbi:MAG: hypothetical protein KF708_02570 [Pirellulales bacterium]|nr:hypothetical protein [Pirellulales bacterium]
MTLTHTSETNRKRVAQAETVWAELLAEMLQRGVHGTAAVEVCVQDGTIQHVRRRVERLEK